MKNSFKDILKKPFKKLSGKPFKNPFRFDLRKGIVGVVLAVLSFAACYIWADWRMGNVFAPIFLVTGFFSIEFDKKRWKYLFNILWGIGLLAITCYSSVWMLNVMEQAQFYLDKQLLNALCALIVWGIAFIITANWRVSVIAASMFLVAVTSASGFVYQFRGKEIGPMDILSAKTALSVASQYTAKLYPSMVHGWCWWAVLIFILFAMPKIVVNSKSRARIDMAIIEMVFVTTLILGSTKIDIKTWDKQGTEINGYFLNFYLGIRDSVVEKPDGYDAEAVETFAQTFVEEESEHEHLPNIIVIMDESFTDFRVLNPELRTNQPVTPFMDSLKENTIRGNTLSSVFGGNTANSEFEFLTSHSMSLLPGSSVPYQQYVNGKIGTLAWYLDAYGYHSFATHPYFPNGWSRNRVYPHLGFDESSFIDSYPSQNCIRGYIADQEMFEYVLQKLGDKEEGKPLFLFGITVQNHGGYTYDNFESTIKLEGYSKEYPQTEQYLTLIHETDKAVEYLLTSLEEYPEDTVVLFFGDHFPQVETEFFNEMHGGYYNTIPEKMKKYTVPFFIWANYDIPEETVEITSLNYLSRRLLEAAGVELSPYYKFIADLEEKIPAMNAIGYYSIANNDYISYDEAEGEEKEWLSRYEYVQHNNLFGYKNRSETFFEKYIAVVQETRE